jgi:hypothetical protein
MIRGMLQTRAGKTKEEAAGGAKGGLMLRPTNKQSDPQTNENE